MRATVVTSERSSSQSLLNGAGGTRCAQETGLNVVIVALRLFLLGIYIYLFKVVYVILPVITNRTSCLCGKPDCFLMSDFYHFQFEALLFI